MEGIEAKSVAIRSTNDEAEQSRHAGPHLDKPKHIYSPIRIWAHIRVSTISEPHPHLRISKSADQNPYPIRCKNIRKRITGQVRIGSRQALVPWWVRGCVEGGILRQGRRCEGY